MKRLLFQTALLALLAWSLPGRAVLVEYTTTNLSGDTWAYDYTVTNNSLGVDLDFLTIYFDLATVVLIDTPTGPADWFAIEAQPDPGIADDGFVDFEALGAGIAPGDSLGGYRATFEVVTGTLPGAQFFEVYDPWSFDVLADGTTTLASTTPPATGVPEPGMLALILLGALALLLQRRTLQTGAVALATVALVTTAMLPAPAIAGGGGGVTTVETLWTVSARQRLSRSHYAYTYDLAVTNTADADLEVEHIEVLDIQRRDEGTFNEYLFTRIPGGFTIAAGATVTIDDAFTLAINRRRPFDRDKVIIEVYEREPPPPPPAPVALVEGNPLDLGVRNQGCSATDFVRVRNRGFVDLDLTVAAVQPDPTGAITLSSAIVPGRVITVPGRSRFDRDPSTRFFFSHAPDVSGVASASVVLDTNDPAQPELLLQASAEGRAAPSVQDVFEQVAATDARVDLLITLDTSGSMGQEIDALRGAMQDLLDALLARGADFHLTVVHRSDGCVDGGVPFIDSSQDQATAQAALESMFPTSLFDGSNAERGFTQAQLALLPENQAAGACNAGFLRDDARLEIIHLSDEPEQSAQAWPFYVAAFQALKADPADVRINGIVGDFPAGCPTAAAGVGYSEAASATGGTLVSICSADFTPIVERLAVDAVQGLGNSFRLSGLPVPGSVSVLLDGNPLSEGVLGDAALILLPETPPDGSVLTADYLLLDCN